MKRMSTFTMAVLLLTLLILIGCGGPKMATTTTTPATDQTIKNIPKWFNKLPEDPNYYFGKGTATSRDMQAAQDKAEQHAMLDISRSIEAKFEWLRKMFQEEVGTATESQYLEQFTNVSKTVVSQVLNGVQEDNSTVMNENGVFRAYVVLRMPVGASLEALQNKLKQQEQLYTRFRSSQANAELEKEVKAFEQYKKEQGR